MGSSDKQPYEMTSEEFHKTFLPFTELSPRVKWRLYRICNKANYEETGETTTFKDFVKVAEEFRWDTENATVLWQDNHQDMVKEALQYRLDVPDEVLAEYPELVEEFVRKRQQQQRQREKRKEKLDHEKEEMKFWRQFK